MPLPFILGAGAAIAGIAGVGSGIKGINKMKDANERFQSAERRHNNNINRFERLSSSSAEKMDALGRFELEILENFEKFSDAIEKIQNRPKFKKYEKEGVSIHEYDGEQLRCASIGAGVLLGSIGSAAFGTAGGFAATGATTAAVVAFGKASTGVAISGLKGAALSNATLAALGGGALNTAPFAGGVALGTTILNATTLGVGLLVGGLIFEATGTKLSEQADEAYSQMRTAEKTINAACDYLLELEQLSEKYYCSLATAKQAYDNSSSILFHAVNVLNKRDWYEFTEDEKLATENTVLLVGLLYKMCQVNLVIKSENEDELNIINRKAVKLSMDESEYIVEPFINEQKETHEDDIFDNIGKQNGEFQTEYGRIFVVANKEIRWNNVLSYLSNMSSGTKIVEFYNCDIYCHYQKDGTGLFFGPGETLIFSNCRIYDGGCGYNFTVTARADSQLIVKDCIFNKSKRFVKLLANAKCIIKNSKLEQVEEFIYTSKENTSEILIQESEIIYPYNSFIFTGKTVKTSLIGCTLLLSNKYSKDCINANTVIMDDCYIYANSKSSVCGSWIYARENNTVIKNCILKNLSLSMALGKGRIYRCHFESCINIITDVFELDSSIFNECTKITWTNDISKISNCIFNKCYDLWEGFWIQNVNFYDSYFINVRGCVGSNGCNFENCTFQDILVGEKNKDFNYIPTFYVRGNQGELSFTDCVFNNIDVRREYFIKCNGNRNTKKLYMKNCEFNDCISRRKDGLFIDDLAEENVNVAIYEDVYQNNCQTVLEQTNDIYFNNSNTSFLVRIIKENRIGTADTLDLMNWESQLSDVENQLRVE